MQAINAPFAKIINGTSQFVIPVFQRDYSWTEAQCTRLWQDIQGVAFDARESKFWLHATQDGGVYVPISDAEDLHGALAIVRQVREIARD